MALPKPNATIMQVVENQLNTNQPPAAKETLERLMAQGISEEEAKVLIGQAIVIEVQNVVKTSKPFNEAHYLKNLARLPEEPEE